MELPSKVEVDLESNNMRYEYDPWLLDDHPLRSHPTECIPGLGAVITEGLGSFRAQWKQFLLRTVGLLVACFVAFQCLQSIPTIVGHAMSRPAASRLSPREWQVKCTFPHSDPRPSALSQSVAAGCDGFRSDIWLHEHDLQMSPAASSPKEENDLQFRLESILSRLRPLQVRGGSETLQTPLSSDPTEQDIDLQVTKSFYLVLDAQSSLHEIYSVLLAQIEPLRQRGYLTTWDGTQLIPGRVTVVVTGETTSESWCTNESSDIFWSSRDDISRGSVVNDHLIPMCAE
ncbi:hypothetical protein N7528_007057 [Penicillium herquei]|nr:hypothetical protein N7528_007057 [Penicillium herquei]